jgi:hypothetical protein
MERTPDENHERSPADAIRARRPPQVRRLSRTLRSPQARHLRAHRMSRGLARTATSPDTTAVTTAASARLRAPRPPQARHMSRGLARAASSPTTASCSPAATSTLSRRALHGRRAHTPWSMLSSRTPRTSLPPTPPSRLLQQAVELGEQQAAARTH